MNCEKCKQRKATLFFSDEGGRRHALCAACGALLGKCIKSAQIVAYEDLGAEAIRRLEVEDFPAIVIIDSEGNNLYETGRAAYLAQLG